LEPNGHLGEFLFYVRQIVEGKRNPLLICYSLTRRTTA